MDKIKHTCLLYQKMLLHQQKKVTTMVQLEKLIGNQVLESVFSTSSNFGIFTVSLKVVLLQNCSKTFFQIRISLQMILHESTSFI